MFLAAAVIFFTYIGFDAIANTAEEVRRCRHAAAWGIVGHRAATRSTKPVPAAAHPFLANARCLSLYLSHAPHTCRACAQAAPVPPAPPFAAAQARNVRHLPWAMVGTPVVAMAIYVMLAFALAVITVPEESAALPWDPTLGPPGSPGQGWPFGPYGERHRRMAWGGAAAGRHRSGGVVRPAKPHGLPHRAPLAAGLSWPDLTTCTGPQVTFTISFVYMQGALARAAAAGLPAWQWVGPWVCTRDHCSAAHPSARRLPILPQASSGCNTSWLWRRSWGS